MNWFRIRIVVGALVLCPLLFFSLSCAKTEPGPPPVTKAPEEVVERRVNFLAVGDIMLSRGVARSIARSGNDPLTPFKKMADVFRSTDFNFGNLESPISGNDNVFGKGLVFNASTRDRVGLKEFNFKMLNLANNHAMDQGLKGLRQTKKYLEEDGLSFIGTGENLDEAWQPRVLEVKGVKIGFVGASYASVNDGGVARNEYVARMEDTARLKTAIEQLKAQNVDFIVATMHAGIEYTRRPNNTQTDFARAAIDYGADIVIGAHPHWAQVFEKYKDKYIFYSLGNFIFDQTWSRDTMEGLALKIHLLNRKSSASQTTVEKIELLPVVIENASTPRLANDAEARQILQKMGVAEKVLQ
ncbi:MAG: CapA family protein [Acidobacteria bacterium]|nr:CapA family protein [Acidobacteriota bacterium]